MKYNIYSITILVFFILSCGKEIKNQDSKKEVSVEKVNNNNLNISILLDLSDRIDPNKYPNPSMEFYQRDAQYINSISKSFIKHLKSKKLILLNDQIGIYFSPEPSNSEINKISHELKVSFDKNSPKNLLAQTENKYQELPIGIYEYAIKDGNYIGSDIWRFFKDKVNDFCIKENHRNILVILTDGYMYHKNSEIKEEGKTSYITPQLIRQLELNKSDWKDKIEKNKYGFIPVGRDLNNLEVLVIGIHPDEKNPFEGDVIETYWENWLNNMNIQKYKILKTDLPSNLDKPISEFILNKK